MNIFLVSGLLPIYVMGMLIYGRVLKTYRLGCVVAVSLVTIPVGMFLTASQLGMFYLSPSAALPLMLYCVILNPGLLLAALTLLFKKKVKRQ
jgi:hypothetical protein